MDKSNLELFKQALNEAVSNKFDNIAAGCTEEIVCSDKHKLAMRTIIYGKVDSKGVWSPKMKRIVAIIVAAALLLTSCGIIFRNEIREVFKELFASITFEGDESEGNTIEDIYQLNYVPDGYSLAEERCSNLCVFYKYTDINENILIFEQRSVNESSFNVDSESGYSKILTLDTCAIYYRCTETSHLYIWNYIDYSLLIRSSTELSNEELIKIINGITVK